MLKRVLTAVALLAVVFGFLLGLRQIHVAFAESADKDLVVGNSGL